jgi:hypothetical protein
MTEAGATFKELLAIDRENINPEAQGQTKMLSDLLRHLWRTCSP